MRVTSFKSIYLAVQIEDAYSEGYQRLILRPFFMFNGEIFMDAAMEYGVPTELFFRQSVPVAFRQCTLL